MPFFSRQLRCVLLPVVLSGVVWAGGSGQGEAAACSPVLLKTADEIGPFATNGSVGVSADTGCAWTASANDSWLSIRYGLSGSGNSTVQYWAELNPSNEARIGTLTVGGQTYTVTQRGLPTNCAATLRPIARMAGAAAGASGLLDVVIAPDCTWSVNSNTPSWLTTTTVGGTGSNSLGYRLKANTASSSRIGSLSAAGQVATVAQRGVATASGCSLTLGSGATTVGAGGGSFSFTLSTDAGCSWNATSSDSWIQLTSAASGAGSAVIQGTVGANSALSSRGGAILIGNEAFAIGQDGAAPACDVTLGALVTYLPAAGGSGEVSVTAPAGCPWELAVADSRMRYPAGTSGTGSGTLAFYTTENRSGVDWNMTLTIANRSITVVQPSVCAVTIDPATATMSASGGTGQFAVKTGAGCSWSASSLDLVVTVTSGGSGIGPGVVTYQMPANQSESGRTASIGVHTNGDSRYFTLAQSGSTCKPVLSPEITGMPVEGGDGLIAVAAPADCEWTSTSSAEWLTAVQMGTGNGTVRFSAPRNTSSVTRRATVVVRGQSATVIQAGTASGCSAVLSTESVQLSKAGGSGQITVTAEAGCTWTASSRSPAWVTVTSGATGTGDGNVTYAVNANSGTSARQTELVIAGTSVTITQAAAAVECSVTLSPYEATVAGGGGNGSFSVTTPAGCAWSVSSNVSWLTITAGANGSGSGTVNYSVAANPGVSERSGRLSIGGSVFAVTQLASATACAVTLSSTSASFGAAAGSSVISVSAAAGCHWTSSSSAGWISFGTTSGTGNGTVTFNVTANTGASTRTGTITIGGQPVTVTQSSASGACAVTLSAVTLSMPAQGGSSSIVVTDPNNCGWNATSGASWLSIVSGASGTGSGTVVFSATANTGNTVRAGTLLIGGKTVTVSQEVASSSCTVVVAPAALISLASSSGTGQIAVTAATGCAWTATSDTAWLTVTSGGSGTANGTVGYSFTANATGAARTGTLTIGGQSVTVIQAAPSSTSCAVTLDSNSITFLPGGGGGRIEVTAATGCAWTVESASPGWLAVMSGASGTGTGAVMYEVSSNTATTTRLSTLSIGGQTFTVSQTGNEDCPITLNPTAVNFYYYGGVGTVQVQTPDHCSWTAASTATWVQVNVGQVGYGSGAFTYALTDIPNRTTRQATVSAGGAAVQVVQSATPFPALRFVPVTPCRLVDTRIPGGFGGTQFAAGESRAIAIPKGDCSIPASAAAYSLNAAVVPTGKLNQLSLYPSGIPRPEIYTLLSPDGRIKSTAAVVAAGVNANIEVYASDATDVVLDINGYFTDDTTALQFYPLTPCRLVDTRNADGALGGPVIGAAGTRTFPVRGVCGLPEAAQAYSVNIAAVPDGPLGYLTVWPTGKDKPLVASLNAVTGAVTSNAAIVPAGESGSIDIYANDRTHVVVDVNGYFAPAATGGLSFYTVPPCRAFDMTATGTQSLSILSANCRMPSKAEAYALTATAVPAAALGYLTLWPTGVTQPLVATLNASDGAATSNAALVPAGASGAISAYLTDLARLVVDVSGYFAK